MTNILDAVEAGIEVYMRKHVLTDKITNKHLLMLYVRERVMTYIEEAMIKRATDTPSMDGVAELQAFLAVLHNSEY